MPDLPLNLLRAVLGVGATTVKAFAASGHNSLNGQQGVTREQLTAIPRGSEATIQVNLEFLNNNRALRKCVAPE